MPRPILLWLESVLVFIVLAAIPLGYFFYADYQAKQSMKAYANEGDAIVHAVWEFHQEQGHWPDSLKELTPKPLSDEMIEGWIYSTGQGENSSPPQLLRFGPVRTSLYYSFDTDGEPNDWTLNSEGSKIRIPLKAKAK